MSQPPNTDVHWSPSSRDLIAELPGLLDRLRDDGFDAYRVSFNLADWDPTPRRTTIGGRAVRLGGFTVQRPDTITVVDWAGEDRRTVVNDRI